MTGQPLWQRAREAAATLEEINQEHRTITDRRIPRRLRELADTLEREAVAAEEHHRLIEDVAASMYRNLEWCCDGATPTDWDKLPPAHPIRQRYRKGATRLVDAFAVSRVDIPF